MNKYKINYTISYSSDNIYVASKFEAIIDANSAIEAMNIVSSGTLNENLPTNHLWYDLDFPKLVFTINNVENVVK